MLIYPCVSRVPASFRTRSKAPKYSLRCCSFELGGQTSLILEYSVPFVDRYWAKLCWWWLYICLNIHLLGKKFGFLLDGQFLRIYFFFNAQRLKGDLLKVRLCRVVTVWAKVYEKKWIACKVLLKKSETECIAKSSS